MPLTHARRHGSTMLFRHEVLTDLRDRFGSHGVDRSTGRATPGVARLIVHRLWSRTDLVLMRVRSDQGLTRDDIAEVFVTAVDAFFLLLGPR